MPRGSKPGNTNGAKLCTCDHKQGDHRRSVGATIRFTSCRLCECKVYYNHLSATYMRGYDG
jgi:hypothetical protein